MSDTNQKPAPATPLSPRRRAVIIGASGGIGAALSRKLAREGFTLALVDFNEKAVQNLSDELNKNAGETIALAYAHDVTQYDSVPALLRRIIADLGGVDSFLYVAGYIHFPALDEYNFAQDQKMAAVNLLGGMAWLGAIAPLFQSAGRGQIVGVSSVAGDRGRIGNPAYNASKAGFTNYLEGLRNRLTRHGVNVLTVKPGMVKTDMLKLPGAPKPILAAEPEQVADLIWDAMRKRRQTLYVAGIWQWVMLVIRHIPSFIFRRLNF